MEPDLLSRRATVHSALGDPTRLAIVDELVGSDRSPGELRQLAGVESNLLAHHLDVLQQAGIISRRRSHGDQRRRYIHLERTVLDELRWGAPAADHAVMFVCTHNSARSQLAAALWGAMTRGSATSAGTHPATRVHPDAVDAARRAGLDLTDATPRRLVEVETVGRLVVTVCDRAHEELDPAPTWLHWSIADPVEAASAAAFDRTVHELRARIGALTHAA